MFEHHLHHVHEVAGTQLGVPSCIHHYVWLRWTRLDIMALAPLLRMYCNMDNTFPASTRKINKWTCGKPDVRAAPRNRFLYCQNIAKVMLVQVLLLLRSSTHTHTHTHWALPSKLSASKTPLEGLAMARMQDCSSGHSRSEQSGAIPQVSCNLGSQWFALVA